MGLADSLLGGYSSDEDEVVDQQQSMDVEGSEGRLFFFQDLVSTPDLSLIKDLKSYCQIIPKVQEFVAKLQDLDNTKTKLKDSLLHEANDLLDDLNEEISHIYSFLTVHYKPIWPELDNLLRNPINFARTIQIIGDDLSKLDERQTDLEQFLRKDEILGLTVSASVLRQSQYQHHLDQHHVNLILEACQLLLLLENGRTEIRAHVSSKAKSLAPNVTALVGPTVAAQFLSVYGLEGLCKIPSCNIPSMGVNRSSFIKGSSGIRNKGYIYYCELVQNVPEEFRVKAMRVVSGKLVLAARVDYSNSRSSVEDDSQGQQWRQQISTHLDKLLSPPDSQPVKPLPKPIDQKSKKRAGRRFRKQKEKMEMSELEKAQNKMAFGEREETQYDAFGDEIGMGMIGKLSTRAISNVKRQQLTKSAATKLEKFTGTKSGSGSKIAQLLDDRAQERKRHMEVTDSSNQPATKQQKTLES
ncbi:hypothetical protein OGAPHI_003982 [Ogataea philodendri]|uniref:Nop domain-containing protein n=1 Tax=Ogataea philodendri TaxID=1378263 RepID=A0A9P8T505_9ASCO|nr:uncharacterized protein OGAPHI_003982 [Ogataea philodendri]KAH3665794.1 hypothetical protein OGAPHI_003982 [Ogataea philodendri]